MKSIVDGKGGAGYDLSMETNITKINRNSKSFKSMNIKRLTDKGIKNFWTRHPLCIQKIELIRSGISQGILDGKDFS